MSHASRPAPRYLGRLSLLVACLLAAFVASTAEASASGKVIGGSPVSASTYSARWSALAALAIRTERDTRKAQFCGGTFITPTMVVTAAHCVSNPFKLLSLEDGGVHRQFNNQRTEDPKTLDVVAGRRVLAVRDGERIPVLWILIHPKYDPITAEHDVALIELRRGPAASTGVVPISPVQEGEDTIWGNGAGRAADPSTGPWIAGWGYRFIPTFDFFFTGQNHKPYHRPTKPMPRPRPGLGKRIASQRSARNLANILEEALVPVQSDAACELGGPGQGVGYGREFSAATMFCAGVLDTHDLNDLNQTNNGVDACYGDSGGPVIASTGSAIRLIGLTSWGNGCATRDTYGVYTRIAGVREFLGADPKRPVQLAARPPISGEAFPGSVLRCGPGRWTGAGTIRYTYRWVTPTFGGFEYEEAYERLPGSGNTRMYRVRPGDAGSRIGCLVIASNGSTTAAENSKLVKVEGDPPVDPEEEADDDEDDEDDDDEEFLF
jgi:trypsin